MNNLLIKNIPEFDRPRERFKKYGVENLSNNELISIIIPIKDAADANAKYNGTYAIFDADKSGTVSDGDIVVFLGNVAVDKLDLNNATAASATGIVIA